jgi:hypothetical protein
MTWQETAFNTTGFAALNPNLILINMRSLPVPLSQASIDGLEL